MAVSTSILAHLEADLEVEWVHTIIHARQVDIEIERTPESLNQRDGTGAGRRAGKACFFEQVRGNAAIHDAEHLAHDRRTPGKQESQRVREAQHPLTHRLCRKDFIDQQRGALSHPPRPTTGTKASSFAAKRHQMLGVTSLATHTKKTMFKAAAFEVSLELALDISRQSGSLRRQVCLERGIVVFDKLI